MNTFLFIHGFNEICQRHSCLSTSKNIGNQTGRHNGENIVYTLLIYKMTRSYPNNSLQWQKIN